MKVLKGKLITDGRGAYRLVKIVKKKIFMKIRQDRFMEMRETVLADMYNVYNLSNDADVRKVSFTKDCIVFKNHEQLYKKKITDQNCVYLIFMDKHKFIGQIRFDIDIEMKLLLVLL